MDDTGPKFITIHTPRARQPSPDPYESALNLVEHVHVVLEATAARFHLKDRLDRSTTQIAMKIARAQSEPKSNRWRQYREVVEALTDITTMLDIVDRQNATTATAQLTAARALARQLINDLQIDAQLTPS